MTLRGQNGKDLFRLVIDPLPTVALEVAYRSSSLASRSSSGRVTFQYRSRHDRSRHVPVQIARAMIYRCIEDASEKR